MTLLGSTPVGKTGGVGAVDARLSPDGRFLYVDESRIGAVGAFTVDGGNLTELGTSSFAPQPVITEDNLVVRIDTVLYFQVTDPKAATYEIADFIQAIEQLTVTTLRNVIGGLDLERAPLPPWSRSTPSGGAAEHPSSTIRVSS